MTATPIPPLTTPVSSMDTRIAYAFEPPTTPLAYEVRIISTVVGDRFAPFVDGEPVTPPPPTNRGGDNEQLNNFLDLVEYGFRIGINVETQLSCDVTAAMESPSVSLPSTTDGSQSPPSFDPTAYVEDSEVNSWSSSSSANGQWPAKIDPIHSPDSDTRLCEQICEEEEDEDEDEGVYVNGVRVPDWVTRADQSVACKRRSRVYILGLGLGQVDEVTVVPDSDPTAFTEASEASRRTARRLTY
jgi:hypothetical protein